VQHSIANFTRWTIAVESGFLAAGVTISVIAGLQSLSILLRWIFLGV
jgi:Flp pilus assembly pilin Flp